MKKRKFLTLLAIIPLGILSTFAQCPSANFTTTAPSCVNTPVNFTNTSGNVGAGWTYFWDFDYPGGGGSTPATSTAQNPTGINYGVGGPGVYTVLLTITNGTCSSTFLMDIDIRKARANFTPSKTNICAGDSVLFYNTGTPGSSPNANVSHSWSFGAGANPSTSNAVYPPAIQYSTPGVKTITHYVTVNYTPCGSITQQNDLVTQNITVNPSPTPSFASNSPVCAGSAVNYTYTGGGGVTFNWDFGQSAFPQNSTAQNPSGIMYSTAGTKTITLSTINSYGCSKTYTNTVLINATPTANFASTAPACTGLPVNFTNSGTSSGVVYSWILGSGATPATSTLQNPIATYSTAGTKLVSYTVTNSVNGCFSSSNQAININQTPTVTFTTSAPQCAGSPVNFTNTGSVGGNWSYNWTFGSAAVPAISNAQNPSGIVYANGGTKKVTLTITDGICTKTDTSLIVIKSLPVANAGKDTVICANAMVQIGSLPIAGNSYNWFPVNTVNSATASNPTVSPIAPTTQYIVTVTNAGTGCINRDTVIVTMLSPLIANAGIDGVICRNDSIQVGVGLIKGQVYSWSPSAGLSSTVSPNPVSSPTTTTIYTLTVTGSGCPAVTDKVTITVHQLPIINAGKDATITVGSFAQLTVTGALQYSWTPPYALNNAGIYNPIATPDSTTNYIVKGTDVYGCVNRDTIRVVVLKPTFWAPNTFTPDGNGYNDVFYVRGEGVKNFEFRVFNNWGEEIFFSNDMKIGWDGTRQLGGEKLPQGAYFFNVRGTLTDGTAVNNKDIVNLIR